MSFLNRYEHKQFSQSGEDGILRELIRLLDPPRFFVEFGVEFGTECNTRALKQWGWCGIAWDGEHANHDWNIYQERITAGNVNSLFSKYRIPCDLGVLSIDIDGNDYHVWDALDTRYRPSIVVSEYNASIPANESRTIPYDAGFRWDGTNYYGASFLALSKLGEKKGYRLVGANAIGVNLFFVRNDLLHLLPPDLVKESETPALIYKPVGFAGHCPDPLHRPWLNV